MITFDTETTGLIKPIATSLMFQPELVEICLIKHDDKGKIIDTFETLIKPKFPIPPETTKVHGIDDSHVMRAPSFIDIYDDLVDFCLGEKTIFAHNAAFDIGMIKLELMRHELEFKFPWPPYQCCTVEASFSIKNKRLTLDKLYEALFNRQITTQRHRARGDVMPLIEIVCELKEQGFLHEIYFS